MQNSSSASDNNASGFLLTWVPPYSRESGDLLPAYEIGGYAIRYITPDAREFTYIDIAGDSLNTYSIINLPADASFEIAAYDTNGLYSEFVPIYPQ